MSEDQMDLREQMQKIGDTVSEYKEKLVTTFKGMEVAVKDWNFSVGKMAEEYTVVVNVKLSVKPKSTAATVETDTTM